jgi:hypothetical protein
MKVPTSGVNTSGFGTSPISSVQPENLLMAAATMDNQGRFSMPSEKSQFPNPEPKKRIKKLKVVK